MGFSSVGSFILMFFGFMVIMTTFVMIYTGMITGASVGLGAMRESILSQSQTSIQITGLSFDNTTSPDIILINLTNDGKRKLDTGLLDVYIDEVKVPRSTDNRTIAFMDGSGVINPLHWDPGEGLMINISLDISGGAHAAVVSTEEGVMSSEQFTV